MAQTNDETFLKKGLSKTEQGIFKKHEWTLEQLEVYSDEADITDFKEDVNSEMKEAIHSAYNAGSLAALDDCKTLLERESKAWDMTMGKTPKITPSPHLVIEKALAELEALKRTFEKGSSNGGKEVLSRNADDKK